jgi:hypothetical protein
LIIFTFPKSFRVPSLSCRWIEHLKLYLDLCFHSYHLCLLCLINSSERQDMSGTLACFASQCSPFSVELAHVFHMSPSSWTRWISLVGISTRLENVRISRQHVRPNSVARAASSSDSSTVFPPRSVSNERAISVLQRSILLKFLPYLTGFLSLLLLSTVICRFLL